MKTKRTRLTPGTRRLLTGVYGRLDYGALGSVYCHEGGDEFWRVKRGLCNRLGSRVAVVLRRKLDQGGRSLYVGAGVAELPALMMETVELGRTVEPYNLRKAEVTALNRACRSTPLTFYATDAVSATGRFDHLWMVSVLNDPERFPHLSPLSYGRSNPLTLDPLKFDAERRIVRALVARCMGKLAKPGLVTTTTEEVIWIAEWCHRHRVPYLAGKRYYETALVGDPICFIQIGKGHSQAAEKVRQHRSRVVQTLNVPQGYASGLRSLRPCWTAFLSSLRDCALVALAVRTIDVRAYQHSFSADC